MTFEAVAASIACEITCQASSMAFERSGRVMLVTEDGTKTTDLGDGNLPSWSQDGTRLVYSKLESLWTVEIRSAISVPLTTNPSGVDSYPSWSPNGEGVAFVRWWADQSYLVVMNIIDGTGRVVAIWWPVEGKIAWSPDGTRIAFTCEGPPPRWESDICVVPSTGNSGYFFTQSSNQGLMKVTVDTWIDSDPAWRPDGRMLAFTTNRLGVPSIALIRPDGSDLTTIVPGHHPSWSPDGSRIVFAGNANDPGLQVISPDGTGLRRITKNAGDTAPSWRR